MKTCLVNLRLKDTEAIDWKKGLVSYLKRSYGSAQWSQFYDDRLAGELNHLRNNANGELALEALLEQNLIYYAFLEQLHMRIGNNSPQLRLNFTWYEAEYNSSLKTQKYSQHNIILEKSCILHNIGVLLTELARDKLSKDYKASLNYMLNAVACFEYLSENFLNSPSVDLQAENTKFLAELCHAQAQELFLLKLINGSDPAKQASLISKLAHSLECLYQTCREFFEDEEEIRDHGDVKWRPIISCKVYLYKAVTAYYHALVLEQQNRHGEALAFLGLSGDYLGSSLPYRTYMKEFVDFSAFKEMLEDKNRQLTKDNDFIFHENVPQNVQLDVVKSMDAAKSTSFPKQLEPYMAMVSEKCDNLYKGIVPMEIYEKESIYSEEKARFLRTEMDVTETADWEYASFMEVTDLPKLVQNFEKRYQSGVNGGSNTQVDMMREQIASWNRVVKESRFSDVDEQMNTINKKRQTIMDLLSTVSQDQKESTVKLKSALVDASESDEKLFSLVKQYINEIKLLNDSSLLWQTWNKFSDYSSNEPSLLDIDDSKTETVLAKLSKVKQLSEDLRVLKNERSRSLGELKNKANNDDITKKILINKGSTDSELKHMFKLELEKFKPFSARIEATVFKQSATIDEVKVELDGIFKLSGAADATGEERTQMEECRNFTGRLQKAVSNFSIFCADLPKGLAFYDSLLKITKDLAASSASHPMVQPLTAPISRDSLETRQLNLESQLENLNISYSSPTPLIPPRVYGGNFVRPTVETTPVFGNNKNSSTAPPVPPKEFAPRRNGLGSSQEFEKEEKELQQNPTSFYNRPSVFDENLYSKFSG